MYQESLTLLKSLDHKPSKKEWNNLAKEYPILTTYSLRMITGLNFSQLCNKIRK
jgi:hypothetical protein